MHIQEFLKKYNIKNEYLILAGLGLLLVVYLALRSAGSINYKIPKLQKLGQNDITKLVIEKTNTRTELVKEGDNWLIEPQKYRADKTKIDEMIKQVSELTLTETISESGNYLLYELDNEKKINIKAWQGEKEARNFDIGKTASTYSHTYVKLSGQPEVYQARENFRSKFDKSIDDLRDKSVLKFSKDEINAVIIKKDGKLTAISKEMSSSISTDTNAAAAPAAPQWKTKEGKLVKENELGDILNSAAELKADSFYEDKKAEEFKNKKPAYEVTFKGNRDYILTVFPKENDKYPAVSSGSDYAFFLSSWEAEKITKDPASLLQ